MKLNKLALTVFLLSLVASALLVYPFYSMVLVAWYKGTISDWAFIIYICFESCTAFGSCFYSFFILLREPSKVGKKTNIALYVLLGMTVFVLIIYATLSYVATKY